MKDFRDFAALPCNIKDILFYLIDTLSCTDFNTKQHITIIRFYKILYDVISRPRIHTKTFISWLWSRRSSNERPHRVECFCILEHVFNAFLSKVIRDIPFSHRFTIVGFPLWKKIFRISSERANPEYFVKRKAILISWVEEAY